MKTVRPINGTVWRWFLHPAVQRWNSPAVTGQLAGLHCRMVPWTGWIESENSSKTHLLLVVEVDAALGGEANDVDAGSVCSFRGVVGAVHDVTHGLLGCEHYLHWGHWLTGLLSLLLLFFLFFNRSESSFNNWSSWTLKTRFGILTVPYPQKWWQLASWQLDHRA